MSFMDNIGKMASEYLGGGGGNQQAAADAASDQVAESDPNELGDHLAQSTNTMDQSSLMGLGQQLLHHFTNNGGYDGSGADAAEAAGTSEQAVASGDSGAVGSLVGYAKQHPDVLQGAASAFMQRNPGAISQLAPGLLQGIMGRLGK